MRSGMPDSWRALLQFLKQMETARSRFTIDNVVDATGLAESSVKTYFSKKLVGLWISRDETGLYRVSGLRGIGDDEFEAVMTQTSSTAFKSFSQWKDQILGMITAGQERGYPVAMALTEILRSLPVRAEHDQ